MTGNIGVKRNRVVLHGNLRKSGLFGASVNFARLRDRLYFKKKQLCDRVRDASEVMADKIAREGLFGEDRGCGYCGTEVEYIPEDALELKYMNIEGNERALKVFNGF